MQLHEKRAFWKFFLAYFGSVALLILVAGRLYYDQQYEQRIKDEHFAIINYARQLKMHEPITAQDINHSTEMTKIEDFSMDTITLTDTTIEKYIPANRWRTHYIHIVKTRTHFDQHLKELRLKVIMVQALLLALFALLSLMLTNYALRPMKEAISKLDRFIKDLIHDLNTPLTTIKLNTKLLSKKHELREDKALKRIIKSSYEISELHDNLKILLEEDTFMLDDVELCPIINTLVDNYKNLYSDLNFSVTCRGFHAHINANAFKQILHNLLSNACKYNTPSGSVSVYFKEKTLYVQDTGSGIKNPERIFERSYSEQSSSGLGLDIVKRLCEAMHIKISVTSSTEGSIVALQFA